MNFVEERILKDGQVKEGDILQVGSFLNHQLDISFLERVGEAFRQRFQDEDINKIVTIEASGIAVACVTARHFGSIPVVFAKKAKSQNLDAEVYSSEVKSYTKRTVSRIYISKKYLTDADRILIVDDFLANGSAVSGLTELAAQAGASVAGIGIVIEKGYQPGGRMLREKGYRVESLAIIESMDAERGSLRFKEQNI